MGFAIRFPPLPHVKRPSSPAPFHISCGRSDFLYVQPQIFIRGYLKTAFETLHMCLTAGLMVCQELRDLRFEHPSGALFKNKFLKSAQT